ncbi:MAG: glycoside hydrolase [Halobacteriales archaeon]|nr:glycoside hydrolase [Halobacteriales archaeon]
MRPGLAALALVVVTLAGCIGSPSAPLQQQGPANLPATDLPRPEVQVPKFAAPIVLDALSGATEPNIRADAQDRVFVTTTATHLWRSLDGGKTFEAVGNRTCGFRFLGTCVPGQEGAGVRSPLTGGGDGALDVDAQGTLHWAGLFGSNNTTVPYQRSLDHGLNWSEPFDLANGNSTDREWIATGKDGAVYAIWRDSGAPSPGGFDPTTFLLGSGPSLNRIMFRASHDNGTTWGAPQPILEEEPIDGTLAVDVARDYLYAAMSPTDGRSLLVLRSLDGGRTWNATTIASRNSTSPVDQAFGAITTFIFPVTAVDEAGTVYVAWAEDATQDNIPGLAKSAETPHVYLSMSKDHGATFSKPAMVSPPGVPALLPAIVAGAPGRVALAWYEGALPLPSDSLPDEWFVTLAESTTADQDQPVWKTAATTEQPIHLGGICTSGTGCGPGDRSRGDFFEVTLRANGQPILAYVQDTGPEGATARARGQVLVSAVTDGTSMR